MFYVTEADTESLAGLFEDEEMVIIKGRRVRGWIKEGKCFISKMILFLRNPAPSCWLLTICPLFREFGTGAPYTHWPWRHWQVLHKVWWWTVHPKHCPTTLLPWELRKRGEWEFSFWKWKLSWELCSKDCVSRWFSNQRIEASFYKNGTYYRM